jgi:hypothetical protein
VTVTSPASGNADVLDFEWLDGVLPRHERVRIIGTSDLDDIVLEADPKLAEIVSVANAGRFDGDLVRFHLIQTNGRFGVGPASDEHFDHRCFHRVATQQGDVGVIVAPDFKADPLPTFAFTTNFLDVIFSVIVVGMQCV